MAALWTECDRVDCDRQHKRGCHGHVRRCNMCANTVGGRPGSTLGCRKCGSFDINENAACWAYPRRGMTVCNDHGALAPQVIAARDRREQYEYARHAMDTFGEPREIGPLEALEEELWRTSGAISFYQLVVKAGELDELKQHTYDDGGRRWEKPSVWLELLNQERRHYVVVAREAARAGIDERRTQVIEAGGAFLAQVARQLLAALGRDDNEGRQIAATVLRSIDGGKADGSKAA